MLEVWTSTFCELDAVIRIHLTIDILLRFHDIILSRRARPFLLSALLQLVLIH